MKYFGYLLVIIHLFLLGWSIGGFSEMLFSSVPWTPFTNQDFPSWWLPAHWGSVLITSIGFLYGYFTSWKKTPQFMLATYLMLAIVCAIETFGFLTNDTKYIFMATEYVAYILILILLFRTKYFIKYFEKSTN